MAIRRGPLSGSIGGGGLTLHWAANTKGTPYDIVFELVTGNNHIDGGTAALHNPFQGAATLTGRGHAVNSSESQSNGGGVTRQVGSYWVAHRIR